MLKRLKKLSLGLVNLFMGRKIKNQFCKGDRKFKTYPFSPQQGTKFNLKTALWLLSTIDSSYELFCDRKIESPESMSLVKITELSSDMSVMDFNFSSLRRKLMWLHLTRKKQQTVGLFAPIIANEDKKKAFVISIAGTSNLPEIFDDLTVDQIPFDAKNTKEAHVHEGFYNFTFDKGSADAALYEQIEKKLEESLDLTKENDIYIAGHSLGGAASTLIALKLAMKYINKPNVHITLYNFGSPRLGNNEFMELLKKVVREYKGRFIFHRVFNHSDIVTQVPLPAGLSLKYNYNHPGPVEERLKKNGSKVINDKGFHLNKGDLLKNHSTTNYHNILENELNELEKETKEEGQ